MKLKVYLIRHGETDFNKQSKEWGQDPDTSLNDLGRAQTRKLAKRIKEIKFDKFYSSDIKRAIETAEILYQEIKVQIIKDERLGEYEPGDGSQEC